ncbi:MAG: hypothetical protein C5B59_14990 [Bacteroidetes bacterium]|nr:MAG: hypothetical protein C5B59_14990 [Bacteroidota bacterium]
MGLTIQSPFSRKARYKLGEVHQSLQYPFHGGSYKHLHELLKQDDLAVQLAPLRSNEHNTSEFELLAICSLIKDRNYSKIFEIGTYDGRTTRAMAMNINKDGHVFTLNLPSGSNTVSLPTDRIDVGLSSKVISGEKFVGTSQEPLISQLWGDSANFDFSPYYNIMDLVFIDGAHSEDYVANDTEKAIRMIRSNENGGLIVWHDAHLFGVKIFLTKWIRENHYPVYFIRDTSLAVLGIKDGKPFDMLASQ